MGMKTVGIVYAISHTAGRLCSDAVTRHAEFLGKTLTLCHHENPPELYKAAAKDLSGIAILLKSSIDDLVIRQKATVIIIAANSVHRAFNELQDQLRTTEYFNEIDLLNIVDVAVAEASESGARKVCIFGSNSTLESGMYQERLSASGLNHVGLEDADQHIINALIAKGVSPETISADEVRAVQEIIAKAKTAGAEGVVFACTDFGTVFNEENLSIKVFDSNACLARAAVLAASTEKKFEGSFEKSAMSGGSVTVEAASTAAFK
jgi:aspartate/glutamate racemase